MGGEQLADVPPPGTHNRTRNAMGFFKSHFSAVVVCSLEAAAQGQHFPRSPIPRQSPRSWVYYPFSLSRSFQYRMIGTARSQMCARIGRQNLCKLTRLRIGCCIIKNSRSRHLRNLGVAASAASSDAYTSDPITILIDNWHPAFKDYDSAVSLHNTPVIPLWPWLRSIIQGVRRRSIEQRCSLGFLDHDVYGGEGGIVHAKQSDEMSGRVGHCNGVCDAIVIKVSALRRKRTGRSAVPHLTRSCESHSYDCLSLRIGDIVSISWRGAPSIRKSAIDSSCVGQRGKKGSGERDGIVRLHGDLESRKISSRRYLFLSGTAIFESIICECSLPCPTNLYMLFIALAEYVETLLYISRRSLSRLTPT